jgi:hypothetical protein
MNYTSGRAFRQALETRLRQQSQRTASPLVRLRKLVAFDRLLARLALSQPALWLLKGGLALQLRLAEKARLTKDVDLLLCQPLADSRALLQRGTSVDLGDWFAFEIAEATPAPEHTRATVRRFPVRSLLDGRTFEDFHVDIGSGTPVIGVADMLVMPPLLAFAGLEATAFPAYPLTQHIAEKVHAYTLPHPSGEGTRVRDLVDLLLIAGHASFQFRPLQQAMAATFTSRQTHVIPDLLPEPPEGWRVPFRALAREVGLAWSDLTLGFAAAAAFMDPVLRSEDRGTWEPSNWMWR